MSNVPRWLIFQNSVTCIGVHVVSIYIVVSQTNYVFILWILYMSCVDVQYIKSKQNFLLLYNWPTNWQPSVTQQYRHDVLTIQHHFVPRYAFLQTKIASYNTCIMLLPFPPIYSLCLLFFASHLFFHYLVGGKLWHMNHNFTAKLI